MGGAHVSPHWLDHYGSSHFRWQQASYNGRNIFHRPIGGVETAFDADGRYHEGRADISTEICVETRTWLCDAEARERVLLAWCVLRNEHSLLKARSMLWERQNDSVADQHFVVDIPTSAQDALQDANDSAVFLEDHFSTIKRFDFWLHLQNTARVVDPATSLSKLFILPRADLSNGHAELRMILVGGHVIMDGLTCMVWTRNFIELLNLPTAVLKQRLGTACSPSSIQKWLPLPQEALYPRVVGCKARQRWFWLLTRILRHVRKPLTAGFPNPLACRQRREKLSLPPTYASVLDYTQTPVINASPISARTSRRGSKRLQLLCQQANASVGAGCFALAALLMMEMYERYCPNISQAERLPFISGFPVNPRAFFLHESEPNSMMLAFCDGIFLPFLPSSLPLDGRLRLLARQAHRQLAAYQKRRRPMEVPAAIQHMSSRGAGRVLANQYISSLERSATLLPSHLRSPIQQPQGAYPARPNTTTQTCGVSSVGRRDTFLKRDFYDLDDPSKDFAADYREVRAVVRPRDGEFLIGISGDDQGLWVDVSIDGSTIDPARAEAWKQRFETILDEPDEAWGSKM